MEYVLTFNDEQMGLLNQAIGELPHKHAVPLINAINQQIAKAAEAAKPEPEKIKKAA